MGSNCERQCAPGGVMIKNEKHAARARHRDRFFPLRVRSSVVLRLLPASPQPRSRFFPVHTFARPAKSVVAIFATNRSLTTKAPESASYRVEPFFPLFFPRPPSHSSDWKPRRMDFLPFRPRGKGCHCSPRSGSRLLEHMIPPFPLPG